MDELTPEVRRRMADLDLRKKFVDDPDWTTRRAVTPLAENAALRAALSRLAACAFGPPAELVAAADAARHLLGE